MKKYAIIVAGGTGSRMGSTVPKQFLEINGKSLLQYTVEAFQSAFFDIHLIIVLPGEHMETGKEMFKKVETIVPIEFAAGGVTRFQSVKNGLSFVTSPSVVFVHDAVRCLVSPDLIRRCSNQAIEKGSAIPVISVKDSIRIISGSGSRAVDRSTVRAVQTPQTFQSDILMKAFEQAYSPMFTDEATVVELSGRDVELIEGEETNIKVTYPLDMVIAEDILRTVR